MTQPMLFPQHSFDSSSSKPSATASATAVGTSASTIATVVPNHPLVSTSSSTIIQLKSVTSSNIDTLKKLHSVLFPVHYSDSFYQQVQQVGEFAKVVYLDGKAVGSICCRIEAELQEEGKYRVYIMTLGVLEPYRRRRLGHLLLQHILDQARLQPTITRVYLHVQTLNSAALSFYHQHGFQKVALVRDYYKYIPDKDAYVVVKNNTSHTPSICLT